MNVLPNRSKNKIGTFIPNHRKSIAVHSLIVLAFVCFLIFASTPLFEKIEISKYEAPLTDIQLPRETNNLIIAIDHVAVREQLIEIDGWAFIEGFSADNSEIFLVLKSNTQTRIYKTQKRIREDVTGAFASHSLNLDNSGYFALIPRDNLGQVGYKLGVFIRRGKITALEYTNRIIEGEAQLQSLTLPPESNNIKYNIEQVNFVKNIFNIEGWAFIEGQSTENSKICVVLISSEGTYIFDTFMQIRPDVTKYFAELNLDLDNSGFTASIPGEKLAEGNYNIGLFIQSLNDQAFMLTKRTLTIQDNQGKLSN